MRALIAVALMAAPAEAGQATCSNPGLPIGAAASSELMPGRLSLVWTTSLLPIHSEELVDDPQGQLNDDTHLRLVETRLAAEYAVKPWLAIGAAFPYRVVDIDVVHRDPTSGDAVPNASEIHGRTETLKGVGDPSLSIHVARDIGLLRLHARAGTSLPFGGTVEDPHLLGMLGQEHEHVQLGTGTFIPFVSAEVQRPVGPVTVAVWGLAHLSLYDNDKGYRAGDRYSGGVTASFGVKSWTVSGAIEGHGETAETWQGNVYTDEGNAGRFDLMIGGGATWHPTKTLGILADLRVPVASHISGTQLNYGPVFGLGIAGTFDVAPRASWRGTDHAVVASPGSAPDLVPVRGRVTVFDLWADWCPPCRDLDDRLAAIARAHPDLAVRKLDVVDQDSPAWKRYLAPGKYELPHVIVFGADGALLFEKSGSPEELARAVEQALR